MYTAHVLIQPVSTIQSVNPPWYVILRLIFCFIAYEKPMDGGGASCDGFGGGDATATDDDGAAATAAAAGGSFDESLCDSAVGTI